MIEVKSVKADDDRQLIDVEYSVPGNSKHGPAIKRRLFTYTDLAQRLWTYNEPTVITIGGEDKLWVPKSGVVEY